MLCCTTFTDIKHKYSVFNSEQRLTEGMKILGCIREIQTTELVINLPNSLNGYVPITSIHDVMNDQLLKSMNDDKDGEDEVRLIYKYIPETLPSVFQVF